MIMSATRLLWLTLLVFALAACESSQQRTAPADLEDIISQPGSLDHAFVRLSVRVPGFAGLYYDDKGTIHMLIVGQATRSKAPPDYVNAIVTLGLLNRAQADQTQVVVEPAKTAYNWSDIVAFKKAMRDVLTLPDVTYLDADEAVGLVTIGIARDGAKRKVDDFATRVGLPAGAWRTLISPYRDRYQDLQGQFRPMPGGVQIKNDAGPFAFLGFADICTLTAVANRFGAAGLVTASHCTRIQGGVEGTSFYQNGRIPFSLDYVGHESADPPWVATMPGCPSGMICRLSDSAFAVIDIGNQNGAMGVVAQPMALCATSFPCTLNMTSPTATIALTGFAPPPILGTFVTKVGRTSGWTGGPVVATCIDTTQKGTTFNVLCQTDFANGSAGGDSGAPVIVVAPVAPGTPLPTTGTLAGILWGGTAVPPITTFSPIGAVVAELAPISFFPPPASSSSNTTGSSSSNTTGQSACATGCGKGRDQCMTHLGHDTRPQDCVVDYHECLVECRTGR